MAIQIPSSPNIFCCITWGNRASATWDKKERKTSVNLIIKRNSSDHSPFDSICSDMQQQVYGTLFRNINELKSNCLKSEAEHYQHCYQRMENTSPCLCLHKWPIFQIFTVSSCTTKQFDKLSTKVLVIWKIMCQMCIILIK